MTDIVSYTLLNPLLTGPLLWALTKAPEHIKSQLLNPVNGSDIPRQVVTVLWALGVANSINNLLNIWSFKNWQLSYSGAPWVWKDEIAVITGGSGNIGCDVVRKLAPTGMRFALLDIQPPPEDVAKLPNVKYYQCNITQSKAIHEVGEAIRSDFGTPTILINNAGTGTPYTILQMTDAALERTFHVNLMSHWYTVREFLPGMLKKRKGHIMSIASMATYAGPAGMSDYNATKAGALSFYETLTQEIRHRYKAPWIFTTCVHPHWVKTAMIKELEENIRKKGDPMMTPEYVGGRIAKAILSKRGGHLILPHNSLQMKIGTTLRGMPSWFNSAILDMNKDIIPEVPDGSW